MKAFSRDVIGVGGSEINLQCVEQIPDRAVAYTIARCVAFVSEKMRVKGATIPQIMAELESVLQQPTGLDLLNAGKCDGTMKMPRIFESDCCAQQNARAQNAIERTHVLFNRGEFFFWTALTPCDEEPANQRW